MPSVSNNALASNPPKTRWGGLRILLISYAFPPLQVPMSQVAAKLVAGLTKQGCRVDVVAGGPFDARFGFDPSLLPYVRRNSASIRYVLPSRWKKTSARITTQITGEVDPMHLLEEDALEAIEGLLGNNYAALFTLSPFHSINPVLVRLKTRYPDLRWIAQFSDPWSKNPLDTSKRHEAWNLRREAETIRVADHLVFTSAPARDLMLADSNCSVPVKTSVVDHSWDPDLYPSKWSHSNRRFIIRHIGTLFGRRTPEHLFEAALMLLQERPELAGTFAFHFVGSMPKSMVTTKAARALPLGTILQDEPVSYLKSLYLMASADALVLIEPDVTFNYFVPSKLIDYVGADRPILALTPPGASREVIERLQLNFCSPGNIPAIAAALGKLLDQVFSVDSFKASLETRASVRNDAVAQTYLELVG
jgi:hypothetical protein